MTGRFVGIDVSKARLEVVVRLGERKDAFHVANTEAGIRGLVKRLDGVVPTAVVMEASGGYERAAWKALHAAGIPVAVMNPRRTKAFATAVGCDEKTDRVDAGMLAQFGERMQPAPTVPPDTQTEELRAMVSRRQQLVGMKATEERRLHHLSELQRVQAGAHIEFINGQVKEIDRAIRMAIRERPEWATKDGLLRGIMGVGPVFSATLIAFVPEAGTISHKQLASLVGVAPYARDSGTKEGRRRICGGRSDVRRVLYMATLAALRSNSAVKEFYRRLEQKKKAPKVAIVACMHKLLRVINAVLRHGSTWDPSPVSIRSVSRERASSASAQTGRDRGRRRGVDMWEGAAISHIPQTVMPFHISTPEPHAHPLA
jgi:transposase